MEYRFYAEMIRQIAESWICENMDFSDRLPSGPETIALPARQPPAYMLPLPPMKALLFPALIAVAALLPLQQSEAAKVGGFNIGYKFHLKVDKVISTKIVGFQITPTKAPIPAGVPKYSRGNRIDFEVVSKGALKTSKFTLPFTSDAGTSNVYNKVVTGASPKTDTAIIYKGSTNVPTGGTLTFLRISGTVFNLTTSTVTYTLKK
jgi:hypothetical protein